MCKQRVGDTCSCCGSVINNTTINSGTIGKDGLSAYEIAIRTGQFAGTEAEFILWLKGPKGEDGEQGGDGTGWKRGFEYLNDTDDLLEISEEIMYKFIAKNNTVIDGLGASPGMSGIVILKQDDLGGNRFTLAPNNKGAAIVVNTNPRAETRLSWERYDDTVYWKNEIIHTGVPVTSLPIFAINNYYDKLDIFHQLGYTEIEISTDGGPWVQFTGPIDIGAVDRPKGYWRARVKALEPTRLVSGISYSNPVYAAKTGFNYTLNLKLS